METTSPSTLFTPAVALSDATTTIGQEIGDAAVTQRAGIAPAPPGLASNEIVPRPFDL
jgi:hypothetical protein